MRAIVLMALLAAGSPVRAAAHDFWIQPQVFSAQLRQPIGFTLLVGHGPDRQRSPIPLTRIVRYELWSPTGMRRDIRLELQSANGFLQSQERFSEAGVHVVALETDNAARSYIPAARFNEYARFEGLTLVLDDRRRRRRENEDGTEIYRRCAKAIVRVGAVDAAMIVSRPLGLSLEIVPDALPIAYAQTSVRVLFRGRPLAGVQVQLTNLADDATPLQSALTDAAGRTQLFIPDHGVWLLNVVWSTPRPRDANTDFETFFSSLSFGT